MGQGFWTAERDHLLRQLLERGYTAAHIGMEIGASRNAVIGRTHRLERAGAEMVRKRGASTGPRATYSRAKRDRAQPSAPQLVIAKTAAPRAPAPPTKSAAAPLAFRHSSPTPKPVVGRGIPRIAPGKACGILQLSGCRFAVGESDMVVGKHLFCNATVEEGHSYCEDHAAVVVNPDSRALIRRTMKGARESMRPRHVG
jgi:hypothetical protein